MRMKIYVYVLVLAAMMPGAVVFADTFPSRPTLSEMNEFLDQATVCGLAVGERTVPPR